MTDASLDRLRRDLAGLVNRGGDVRAFSLGAARLLRRSVPFDGVCMLTLDPATFLPTGEVSENALPSDVRPRLAQLEIGCGDVNSFDSLIRSGRRAGILSQATDGNLDASPRHSELRAPNGFGDELRAILFNGEAAWGGISLLRADDRGDFTSRDACLLASVSELLAEGVRRAILLTALTAGVDQDGGHAGLVLLASDNSVARIDSAGERWLADLGSGGPCPPVPDVVAAVAARACGADGSQEPVPARARVRTRSGSWIVLRASVLSGRAETWTAVTFEPTRPHDMTPMIADAYGFSARERTITQLVAQGFTTRAIAGRLHISPWTVQDHLKSIFEKVGVSTRGELVGRVFFEHYAPRLSEQLPLGRDGWFESSPGREAARWPDRHG